MLQNVRMVRDVERLVRKGDTLSEIPPDNGGFNGPYAFIARSRQVAQVMKRSADARVLRKKRNPAEVDVVPTVRAARTAAEINHRAPIGQAPNWEPGSGA